MAAKEKIEHEGIVKNVSADTLEINIISRSATITVQHPQGEFKAGEKVMVYASLNNAFYSVLLAYILPSILIITAIFFIEKSGCTELVAAVSSLSLLAFYFFILYLFRRKISKKIKFNVEKEATN